ncbi:MAG: rubrerythrin family protein [Candidatus Atribacteria bacterium]|nr:rubrerythrin family protein [Candidatus Atribacteria bacterium]
MDISLELQKQLLEYQRNEITENYIYLNLAKKVKSPENRQVLEQIAQEELRHYHTFKNYTQREVKPDWFEVQKYYWISRIFGLTFGVKLMENGEEKAQANYDQLSEVIPQIDTIMQEENKHEHALLELIDEERLHYIGSVVLGLNDALVELTGALAGFTLALQNTRLIAMTGLVTGIAAALSMSASEYLSTKSEGQAKDPVRASFYTGFAYIMTVILLILPYLFFTNYYFCLVCTLAVSVAIIAFFNYYLSVAQGAPFGSRFLEMIGLSFGVAGFSFFIGFLMRFLFGIEV